ncbi:MAG: esterase family protein [Candidatus Neomarinimicrobiota bacterium]|nr:MAG: esterase family protein [Candidatus Neomarinimicrobiota bacterium]
MRKWVFGLVGWTLVLAGHIDTVSVPSPAMKRDMPAIVVTPENSGGPFPVVYLLHGYSGSYQDWNRKADLAAESDRYGVILVCPEGGYNSWYLDSPVDPTSQYESWIVKDLIPWVDHQYSTRGNREYRAITGLSMGGHGALYLAIRHPDLFSAAGSMSGGVDLRFSTKRWEISEKLGPYEDFPERWKQNSIVGMIEDIPADSLALFIDCGVNDFFIEINRTLHRKLLERNLPHEYIERPGGHSWSYWTHALDYHLLFFRQIFDARDR